MLTPTLTEGGQHSCQYNGPCGVSSGSPEVVEFDLTVFSVYIRKELRFREQLWALIEAVSPDGVTAADTGVLLPAAPAIPERLSVQITSSDAAAGLKVRIASPHTGTR